LYEYEYFGGGYEEQEMSISQKHFTFFFQSETDFSKGLLEPVKHTKIERLLQMQLRGKRKKHLRIK
jgi:hypothetical protein